MIRTQCNNDLKMCNMKKYIFFFPFLFSLILLSSCSEPERTIIEGVIPYFESEDMNVEVSADNNGKFSVDVYRINPVGSADVNLSLALPKGISADMFELTSNKVSFKDGEYKSSVDVKFDLSKMVVPIVYDLKLSIEESPLFGFVEPLTISVNKEWVFDVNIGKGHITSEFMEIDEDVEFKGIDGSPDVYQIINGYGIEGYPINFAIVDDTIDDTKPGKKKVIFPTQDTGDIYPGYGMINVSLVSAKVEGKEVELELKYAIPSAGVSFNGTFFDNITLP